MTARIRTAAPDAIDVGEITRDGVATGLYEPAQCEGVAERRKREIDFACSIQIWPGLYIDLPPAA
jgi:hypothetical protein